MSIIQGNAHTSAGGGYQIERSLRFNSADSAYLNRTPASAGNRKTWTWSGWVKRGALGSAQVLFGSRPTGSSNESAFISFNSSNAIYIFFRNPSDVVEFTATTNAVFRDPSAWYHVLFYLDTTQSTSTNRMALYVNGVQQTFSTSTYPTQNLDCYLNQNVIHFLGSSFSDNYFDGYLTEINFIGGQALTPSSFGETDSATGVWKPKAFSGTYGTNGFYLKFADNSGTTSTTLGKDSSGNGNNWTPNNFSVTAGAGNDSLVDSPTSYGTDTGVGGEVRGNYCTLNPVATNTVGVATLSNGNLDFSVPNTFTGIGTISAASGKYYWEVVATSNPVGVGLKQVNVLDRYSNSIYYMGSSLSPSGEKYVNGSASAYGASWTTGDVIGVAVDMGAGTVTFYKNGASQGAINLSTASITEFIPSIVAGAGVTFAGTANFGQRAFAYTAPSGFKALCTQNLPTPTIGATNTTQANDYFNAVTYSGSSAEQNITGVGFQPDFVWIKSRSNAESHVLSDAVRGATGGSYYRLFSDATAAESANVDNSVLALNADGFRVSGGTAATNVGRSGYTYVSWNWKANGAGSSNTAGTITSTVSANTTSGFSIVTYTGTGSAATVGHGLGVAPSFVIVKFRTEVENWYCYHVSIGNTKAILLNTTGAATGASANYWNNTTPTSSVVSLGGTTSAPYTYVMYCFAPVAGYSAFGSYTGNGSTSNDGPFIYTGFRPRFIMGKRSDSTGGWWMFDTARSEFNLVDDYFYAHLSDAEFTNVTTLNLDVLSNGFKVRSGSAPSTWINASGGTYIYMAFAETPAKFSLAR